MTGTVVSSRRASGLGAVIWAFLGAAALVAAVATESPHWAVLAVLPLLIALALMLSSEPVTRFEITERGLSFEEPEVVFVPFADLQGLTAPDPARREQFAIQVYHSGGVVRIPARLDVSSKDLYQFLYSCLPPVPGPNPDEVPAALRKFVAEQIETFGPERVQVYLARRHPPAPSNRRSVAVSWAVMLTGILWGIAGGVLVALSGGPPGGDQSGFIWICLGILLFLFGLLFVLVTSRQGTIARVPGWDKSCVVISPGGIALSQGSLKGKMRWDELREIDFPARPRLGLATAGGVPHGIGLLVEGAYLVIADYYDRPLSWIHRQLTAYWGGREAN
jgi:hypothetical protein